MRHLWPTVYFFLGLLSLSGGRESLALRHTADTNVDWVLVSICFVLCTSMPFLTLWHYGSQTAGPFPRPSLHRKPLGYWRTDPLQWMRLSTLGAFCAALGASSALPTTDQKGVMIFWMEVAFAAGFFLGELLFRLLYARRIA